MPDILPDNFERLVEEGMAKRNEFGVLVGCYVCATCGGEYTVCPAPETDDGWENCMAKECASYDPTRDADRLFDDGNVLSLEGRRQPIIRRDVEP